MSLGQGNERNKGVILYAIKLALDRLLLKFGELYKSPLGVVGSSRSAVIDYVLPKGPSFDSERGDKFFLS